MMYFPWKSKGISENLPEIQWSPPPSPHVRLFNASYDFWLKKLRDSKAKVEKDHGKMFQSKLAASLAVLSIIYLFI